MFPRSFFLVKQDQTDQLALGSVSRDDNFCRIKAYNNGVVYLW